MEKSPRLTAEQRDDLVAYLDEELDPTATQHIENVLSRSPVARHEVEMLVRTWELLDELPKPTVSGDFTTRTVARIEVEGRRTSLLAQPWFRQARRGAMLAGWAAGLAAAAVIGFLTTNRWIPNDSELLVRDLPVIENLDVYTHVGEIDFLQELQKRKFFEDDSERAEP